MLVYHIGFHTQSILIKEKAKKIKSNQFKYSIVEYLSVFSGVCGLKGVSNVICFIFHFALALAPCVSFNLKWNFFHKFPAVKSVSVFMAYFDSAACFYHTKSRWEWFHQTKSTNTKNAFRCSIRMFKRKSVW